MNMLRSTAAASLVAALGCDGGFNIVCPDVAPPQFGSQTRLQVNVRFLDPRPAWPDTVPADGHLQIDAYLEPGIAPGGRKDICGRSIDRRPVVDDTLTVIGFKLVPMSPAGLNYSVEVEMTSAEFAALPIDIEPPKVAGVLPDSTPILWYGLGRAAGDTIVLSSGEDLELQMTPPADASFPTPREQWWNLSLAGDTAGINISSPGLPPETLVISNQLLPGSGDGVLHALLQYMQGWFDERYGQPDVYAIDLYLDVQLGWTVSGEW
jgi:hypothetical protein